MEQEYSDDKDLHVRGDLEGGRDQVGHHYGQEDNVVYESHIVQDKGPAFRWLSKLFQVGVEARGIERVPEDERDGRHTIGLLLLWWSVNMVVSTVPIGVRWQTSLSIPLLAKRVDTYGIAPRSGVLYLDIPRYGSCQCSLHGDRSSLLCIHRDPWA